MTVKIYPSNWLMTVGIVGFAKIFGKLEYFSLKDNYVEIKDFEELKNLFFEKYFSKAKELKVHLKTFYNNSRVSNNSFRTLDNNIDLKKTKKYFFEIIKESDFLCCSFCNERKSIKRQESSNCSYVQLDEVHFTPLASSSKKLTNLYWEGKPSNFLCLPCELIIYCAAFGFTKVDNKYVFINAPASINEVIEINNIWSEYLEKGKETSFKESLIEILKRIEKMKAKWSIQNISFIELMPYSENSFNVYSFHIPVETAYAVRKLIQSYPSSIKEVYDIFLDCVYSKKPLYDMTGKIIYGFLSKERLQKVDKRNFQKTQDGRLVLSGINLKNPRDLIFFLKFQKEVDEYGQ